MFLSQDLTNNVDQGKGVWHLKLISYSAQSSGDLVRRSLHDADQGWYEPHLHGALAAFNLRQLFKNVLSWRSHHRVWGGEIEHHQRKRGSKMRHSNVGKVNKPLLYLRKIAMVRGQILFSALVVKAGSTVQTMHRVSMTSVSTSELNWAASWTRPSRMLGRKGWSMCVLSESFSWSQYLRGEQVILAIGMIKSRPSFLQYSSYSKAKISFLVYLGDTV